MERNRIILITMLAGLVLLASGCTGNSSKSPSGPVSAKWVQATVIGDTVMISKADVDAYTNVHFYIPTAQGQKAFMAYKLDGRTYVRANVCPPCGSIGFSLSGDTLVCDTCGTTFAARTGAGISGACVSYPKEEVSYTIDGSNIVIRMDDAASAYAATMQIG